MIRKPITFRRKVAFGFASVALLVLGYSWLSYSQHMTNPNDTTIPNLTQFIEGMVKVCRIHDNGECWLFEDSLATFGRHAGGMLVGLAASIFIGMWMACYKSAEAFFTPPLSMLANIPPTAMMAVYFVLFGTDYQMFVAMIALGIIPTLAQSIQSASKDVHENEIYKAYTLGASSGEIVYYVVFRKVLPRILDDARLQVGPALVFLIAAELLVGDVGFGYRIRIQSRLLNMNVVYIYLAFLGLTFFMMKWSLLQIRKKICPWYGD